MRPGVEFSVEPTRMGDVTLAVFDDTVDNRIQLAQGRQAV